MSTLKILGSSDVFFFYDLCAGIVVLVRIRILCMVQCKEEMGNYLGAINVYAYTLAVPMVDALNYPTHEGGGEVVEQGVEACVVAALMFNSYGGNNQQSID